MKPDDGVSRILQDEFGVSRETLQELEDYAALLVKWNAKINLVSPATLPELWTRHILDSAQLFHLLPGEVQSIGDIGSGGGLPGLILAILAKTKAPKIRVTMIESDRRKCAFLQTVSGQLGLGARILPDRIESAAPLQTDVLSARALAPLPKLMGYAARHLAPKGHALLMKGANVETEIEEALASWTFDLQKHPSQTQAEACILEVFNIRPR
ncbi:MAG: 16S rRNA (guanine(527)-N(7))-methyltransferase RsmG [Pseudomonadota bacterium]